MRRFWDIRLVSIQWPRNLSYGSLKVIGTDTDRSAIYDFLLTFYSNHGHISYRFRDKWRFQSKIAKFSNPPCILRLRWRGYLGIGYRRWGSKLKKKLERWRYQAEKEVWRYLQPSGYNAPTWWTGQTGRQTDRHRATAKTALTHSVAR